MLAHPVRIVNCLDVNVPGLIICQSYSRMILWFIFNLQLSSLSCKHTYNQPRLIVTAIKFDLLKAAKNVAEPKFSWCSRPPMIRSKCNTLAKLTILEPLALDHFPGGGGY